MKRLSLLLVSLSALPCLASADQAFLSLNGGPMEPLGSVAVGTVWVPGVPGAVGAAYSSISFGDLDPDKVPDLMAMLQNRIHGSATPASFVVSIQTDSGKLETTIELDGATIYSAAFDGVRREQEEGFGNDLGKNSITVTSPSTPTVNGANIVVVKHVDQASLTFLDVQIQNVGRFDPTTANVSPIKVTFGPPANPAIGVVGPPPTISEFSMSEPIPPAGTDDPFDDWMNSTIANNGDEREIDIRYVTPAGNIWTLSMHGHMTGNHKDTVVVRRRRKKPAEQEEQMDLDNMANFGGLGDN